MNLQENPTPEQLRHLLRSVDDKASHHTIWVGEDGEVHLSRSSDAPKGKFRLESFVAGNGYTGEGAANDEAWVDRLYKALVKLWRDGEKGFIDFW